MPNYFYTDAIGRKQGPVNDQQLKVLVSEGVIKPATPLETEGGHKGLAGQIPDLFPNRSFEREVPPPTPKRSFCTNCGTACSEQAVACMSCGAKPVGHRKFCRQCAVAIGPEQVVCVKCGAKISGLPPSRQPVPSASKQVFCTMGVST